MRRRHGSAAEYELAVAMAQELYPMNTEKRRNYVRWRLGRVER